jgi:hypothetical protein
VLRLDGGSTGWATAFGRQVDATGSFTLTAWVEPTNPADNGIVFAAPGSYETAYQLDIGSTALWSFRRHAQDVSSSTSTQVPADDAAEYGGTHGGLRRAHLADAARQRRTAGRRGRRPYATAQTAKALSVGWAVDNGAAHRGTPRRVSTTTSGSTPASCRHRTSSCCSPPPDPGGQWNATHTQRAATPSRSWRRVTLPTEHRRPSRRPPVWRPGPSVGSIPVRPLAPYAGAPRLPVHGHLAGDRRRGPSQHGANAWRISVWWRRRAR